MLRETAKLWKMGWLSPKGVWHFTQSILSHGVCLHALLAFQARRRPQSPALNDGTCHLSYQELELRSLRLAAALRQRHFPEGGGRAALLCDNIPEAVAVLFALSRLGVHTYLLHPDMGTTALRDFFKDQEFNLLIHAPRLGERLGGYAPHCPKLVDRALPQLWQSDSPPPKLPRYRPARLTILTGGTTGIPKAASRRPSLGGFVSPFLALLTRLDLDRFQSVYIPTPLYHGFGLSSLLMGFALGAEVFVNGKFEAAAARTLIWRHKVEVVTLVPTMLRRLLRHCPDAGGPLRRVICGGAPLDPQLAKDGRSKLGDVICNLYGTTEAGFCIMAAPDDLAVAPRSVGRPIRGVALQVRDADGRRLPLGETGVIHIKNNWAMDGLRGSWVATGDLGYKDVAGRVFLMGRADNMIVSGGENVYPVELEHLLATHPAVADAAAIGVPDGEFGQRLRAFVTLRGDAGVDSAALLQWLRAHAAPQQMPVRLDILVELPMTPLGKIDRVALRIVR